MPTFDVKIACQRCGGQMEMKDPAPGAAWRPDQFWVCPKCGRHFWSTYPAPAAAPVAAPAAAAAAAPAGTAPRVTASATAAATPEVKV